MQLHIVGCGCPDPRAHAHGSCFLLAMEGETIMIDCGPAATYKMARMGLKPTDVARVFLTHHHFDHNADFPCFALTWWDQSTQAHPPLYVYGPPPTQAFVERLFGEQGAYHPDIHARLKHPASHWCHARRGGELPRHRPQLAVHDVGPGAVQTTDAWKASAAQVKHCGPWLDSLAYRFETPQGSIVFAADCGDCQEIRDLARGAGTLVMACTHWGADRTDPQIADVITGVSEVIAIANDARIGRVVLSHTNTRFAQPTVKAQVIARIARSFHGEILFPDELTTIQL
jgi:ribonuclease BN (tRNA processing enzyme)